MGFGTAVSTCLGKKYMDFKGRARRSEFWYFFLFSTLVTVGVDILVLYVEPNLPFGRGLLTSILQLPILLPSLAVWVRRLHDIDKTGWWMLLLVLGPVEPVVGLIAVIFLLYGNTMKGTSGPNRYGLDPTQGDASPV
jgi:uncharacterized membrane protein YhaH (DUF805 family)